MKIQAVRQAQHSCSQWRERMKRLFFFFQLNKGGVQNLAQTSNHPELVPQSQYDTRGSGLLLEMISSYLKMLLQGLDLLILTNVRIQLYAHISKGHRILSLKACRILSIQRHLSRSWWSLYHSPSQGQLPSLGTLRKCL